LNDVLAPLKSPELDPVLDQFNDWRDPTVRHGIVPRLIRALEHFSERP
jgi:hypothetical protein